MGRACASVASGRGINSRARLRRCIWLAVRRPAFAWQWRQQLASTRLGRLEWGKVPLTRPQRVNHGIRTISKANTPLAVGLSRRRRTRPFAPQSDPRKFETSRKAWQYSSSLPDCRGRGEGQSPPIRTARRLYGGCLSDSLERRVGPLSQNCCGPGSVKAVGPRTRTLSTDKKPFAVGLSRHCPT